MRLRFVLNRPSRSNFKLFFKREESLFYSMYKLVNKL